MTGEGGMAALRATLARLEGRGVGVRREVAGLGLPALEAALPGGGLRRGALHEVVAAEADRAAAEGFAVTLAARLAGASGLVLWCGEAGHCGRLYGPGLARLGLAPERILLVEARKPADRLWAMEEGLRTPGIAVVLGEAAPDLTESRRLQLAAEAGGAVGLVLRRLAPGQAAGGSVAVTRWRVASVPGGTSFDAESRDFGLMRARWQVTLERCRGAVPAPGMVDYGAWLMEEGDASGAVPVARELGDRSPASPAQRRTA